MALRPVSENAECTKPRDGERCYGDCGAGVGRDTSGWTQCVREKLGWPEALRRCSSKYQR